MPDGRIVGLEEEEAEAIMEFQEEAGITELQEEYEQYTEEEYEVETQEEPTEAKLLNVTEEELERLLSASNGNNYLGYNEIKGVEYQYYYSEKWQEIYAKCVIQDEIYELEEEIEYLDVIFPVSSFGGVNFDMEMESFTLPSHIKYLSSLEGIVANEYIIPDTVESITLEKLFEGDFERDFTVSFPEGLECYGTQEWYRTFANQSGLKCMTIPEGTKVLEQTYSSCDSLEEVTHPESLETIGEDTFSGCKSLKSIVIPSNVKNIGSQAFGYCDNLTTIDLPEGLESLGDDVFNGCSNLTELIIPDSVTECPDNFNGIQNLKLLVYPKDIQLKEWQNFEFYNNKCLEKIVFPNTITDLDVDFPESVKTIEVPEDLVDYLQKKYPDIEVKAREQ